MFQISLVSSILSAMLLATNICIAQEPNKSMLKEDAPTTGSMLKRNTLESNFPFNKKYHELSQEEREIIHCDYENIAEGDEPPYPANGLTELYTKVVKAQQYLALKGTLLIVANVSSLGEVDNIEIYSSPDPDMTRIASLALLEEKFKPAICAGKACRMQYIFRMNFIRRLN